VVPFLGFIGQSYGGSAVQQQGGAKSSKDRTNLDALSSNDRLLFKNGHSNSKQCKKISDQAFKYTDFSLLNIF
jgi:hypothetical protein